MLISKKKSLIFISNPKTGTTFIQKELLVIDPEALLNSLPSSINYTRKVSGKDEHITAEDLKQIIGNQWGNFRKIVFIRDPFEKAVSTYFFYKNGKPLTKKTNKRQLFVRINQILVHVLPFSIWSLIKPIKKNSDYILDDKGVMIVNHIGLTNRMKGDLIDILNLFGINYKLSENVVNKSMHKNAHYYFKNKLHLRLFQLKYSTEIELFLKMKNHSIIEDLVGKRISDL